ncbi:MAG: Spx/MgsR family RNA polymerase-binding regulatory protein [Alphaproteobacteria bacterium]|nr:Spx/MgsR family RNA polymerase-binding regulatory protein [Alphaproteobacteria bacterium]
MSLTVYGIPSCGTVKKAWRWLDDHGLAHERVNLRETPPDAAQVQRWVEALGAKALRNTSGGAYRALGPEKQDWSDARWAEAFAQDPMLIKRPVIERDGEPVSVGFKESRFEELFGA